MKADEGRAGKGKVGPRAGRAVWSKVPAALAAVAVLFFLVRGCALMPWNKSAKAMEVRVTITRDFGTVILRDGEARVKDGDTAMLALHEVAEVETAYGGGFITGIDGLRSTYGGSLGGGEEVDWFFYVNGQMADVGAADYRLREGDWVVFDYHPWSYSMFTTLLAGCFPEPFRKGYGGRVPVTVGVLHTPGAKAEAEEVVELLRESGMPCEVAVLDGEWEPREGEYEVIVGIWKEMESNAFLREVQKNAARLGLYAYFQGERLMVLDGNGREARSLSWGAGLVGATGPRLGDGRTVLLVAGLDEEGLRAAGSALRELAAEGGRPVIGLVAVAGEGSFAIPWEVR